MPKASTSSETLTKISKAMEVLKKELSYDEYRKWDGRGFPSRFAISTTFSTVLRNLGAIKANPDVRGEVRLTERMTTLRPSTVQKNINRYQAECRDNRSAPKKRKKRKAAGPYTIRFKEPINLNPEPTFETIMVALKEQVRKEVMAELMSSVTNA